MISNINTLDGMIASNKALIESIRPFVSPEQLQAMEKAFAEQMKTFELQRSNRDKDLQVGKTQTKTFSFKFTYIPPKFTPEKAKEGHCHEVVQAIGDESLEDLRNLISKPETDTNKSAEVIFKGSIETSSLRPLSLAALMGAKEIFQLLLEKANSYTLSIHLQDHYENKNLVYFNNKVVMRIAKSSDELALSDAIADTRDITKKAKFEELARIIPFFQEIAKVLPRSLTEITFQYLLPSPA